MLKLNLSDEQGGCFKFLGESSSDSKTTHLITNNTSLLVSSDSSLDSCSFGAYFNDSDAAILAFGESYFGGESCGSIAFSGGESCGSIASGGSSGGFSGGGFSGGGCSAAC